MIKTDTPFAQLLFTTIRIEAYFDNGQQPHYGTGFYFLFDRENGESIQVLITNKHVIQDADQIAFYLQEAISFDQYKPKEGLIKLVLEGRGTSKASDWWVVHPGDVDLCALPCNFLHQEAQARNKVVYTKALGEESLATDDELNNLTSFEDIFMLGFPIGLRDEVNNLPLVRRGILSSHPALDFNGQPIGVVDIGSFPGSSGSPIFSIDVEMANKSISSEEWRGDRSRLIGILFGCATYTANGKIEIVDVPTNPTTLVNTAIPAHLGFYIKARELLTLKKCVIDMVLHYRKIYGIE